MIAVFDTSLKFKDDVVRAAHNKTKEVVMRKLIIILQGDEDTTLLKKLRRAEKGIVTVTNDVIVNAVQWCQKRPGITSVVTTHKHKLTTCHQTAQKNLHSSCTY